jgi:triosephosphate isomerase
MARFGSLLGDASVMEETDKRLQCAIEDLRVKYERIRQEEEKAKQEKEAAAQAKAAAEASIAVENDWTIGEDAELEGLRQARPPAVIRRLARLETGGVSRHR